MLFWQPAEQPLPRGGGKGLLEPIGMSVVFSKLHLFGTVPASWGRAVSISISINLNINIIDMDMELEI